VGKYTADIEIAVRGGRELAAASQQVAALGKSIANVNKVAQLRGSIPASINNYQAAVQRADTAVRQSVAGTRLQKQAIDVYVKSLYQAEQAEKQLTSAIAKRQKELNISTPKLTTRSGGGGGVGKAVGGSLSSAAIGGAFPLLFGQSPQAAVGGAIGGLLGGAGGGFAGSLLGTALGELEAAKARTKELTLELGLSSTQAKTLATAFELAGRNSQQLEAAVTNIQGLGLSTKETASAIKIAVELSKEYGGSVEKIAQSFADTLESGKVSITTLNKFTAQGIPIQDELAKKFGVSRTKLLEMAKDGEISVQQLTDALVEMGREAEATADKGETGFDRFTRAVKDISTAIASAAGALLKILIPALDAVLTKLSAVINRATQAINLVTDAQVGSAESALFKVGMSQGMFGGFAQSKGNIDLLTDGLKTLKPQLATNQEELNKFAGTMQSYRTKLRQFGGETGNYAVKTAQVELSRVERDIAARATALKVDTRVPAAAQITDINAPANLPPSGGSSEKAANDAKRAAEQAAKAEKQIQERLRGLTREIELNAQISTIKELQFQAEMDGNKELQARLQGEERIIQIMQSTAQSLDGITDQRLQQKILAKAEGEIASANQETALEMQRIEAERTKSFDAIIADLNLELALKTATTEQERERLRIEAARAKLQADLKGQGFEQPQIDQITGLQAQVAAPLTDVQKIDQHIGKLKDEITSLTSISNIAITAAAGIGSAFATSFKGLIDGSMSAKEALGSFFKSVADMFLEMAAQIIAKQVTMIILQTILKALGAVAGGGGGANLTNTQATDFGFNPSAMTGSLTPGGLFAKGGAFTNSVVSSPTMFKFADGGAMRTGLMGEAGPEAIMPLKRGADGSLGVMASGGGGDVNVVVNVDAKGSSVEGDEQGANQLGRVISAAVQSELIKQQRPGGILAR
jgi:lambda family phage tail tape measure protein